MFLKCAFSVCQLETLDENVKGIHELELLALRIEVGEDGCQANIWRCGISRGALAAVPSSSGALWSTSKAAGEPTLECDSPHSTHSSRDVTMNSGIFGAL